MNIAVHKFYDNRNQNGFWFQIITDYVGLMDEGREYFVVSEVDNDYWVEENEITNQNTAI